MISPPSQYEGMKGLDMNSKFRRLRWGCFLFLLLSLAACTLTQSLKKPEEEKEFVQETLRLEKLAREHPEPQVRAESHLKLAFLYVNWRNPRLNYTRALQEMANYRALSSDKVQTDDFQNWFAVLKELERARKDKKGTEEKKRDLETQIDKLRISLKKVQDANKNLGDEVTNLQETIEKLKDLDVQMEEKRNLIK